jgi:hypothetical protein
MRDVLLRGQHVLQLALGLYGGMLSIVAITRLQKYESTSKKLAEWSTEAANQLHKTRTTQTSGALAVRAVIAVRSHHLLTNLLAPCICRCFRRAGICAKGSAKLGTDRSVPNPPSGGLVR